MSAPRPPSRHNFRTFESHDPEETLNFVSKALAPHEMRLRSTRPMATQLSCLDLGEAQIVDLCYGTDVRIDPARVEDSYLVHVALSGSSVMWDDAQPCTVRPGAIPGRNRLSTEGLVKSPRTIASQFPRRDAKTLRSPGVSPRSIR